MRGTNRSNFRRPPGIIIKDLHTSSFAQPSQDISPGVVRPSSSIEAGSLARRSCKRANAILTLLGATGDVASDKARLLIDHPHSYRTWTIIGVAIVRGFYYLN